jgi:hypothetical protein
VSTDVADVDDLPTPAATRSSQKWSAVVIACALLPFAVSAIRLAAGAGRDYHPFADQATIESLVRDVGSHWLLLGPFSRFGWFHPGPALYYLLALPYRLTGSSSGSLAFAALCLNAAAVLGVTLVARRRGGLPLLVVTTVVVLLLVRTLGAQFLRDPWNPYVTLLPFLLLLFLAWTMACGDRWALPVGIGVGSVLVQTHVGYALVVAAVLATGIAGLVLAERRARRGPARRPWWQTLAVTGAVVFVLWLPVVVQQITQDPGNLSALIDFFGRHGREQSYEDAWHVLALQLGAWPDWLAGASRPTVLGTVDFTAALPVPLGLFALLGATVVTWVRRCREAFLFDAVVVIALAASYLAMTRIVGDVLTYLVQWTWALGAATWIAVAWSCVAVWRTRQETATAGRSQFARVSSAVVVAGLGVILVVDVVAAARAGTPEPAASAAMGRLGDAAHAALPAGDGAVEVRVRGAEGAYWTSAGVADVLEHHGLDVRVGPELEFAYGHHRLLHGDRLRARVLIADGGSAVDVRSLARYRLVARDGDVMVFVEAA